MSRKVLLAGIGAAVLAQEEINNYVEKLTERGEIAEKDARQLIKETMERRDQMERERKEQEAKNLSPVATKAEVDALTQKVTELTKLLEEMKKIPGKVS
jgi:polyhydroxyalkanoate synthesis regulator phasin